MPYTRVLSAMLMGMVTASCVTINVYFPAAAADTAAKTIVRDVLGETPPTEGGETGKREGGANLGRTLRSAGVQVLDLVVTPARAAADLKINTPAISAIRSSLRQRQSRLNPYMRSGAVGLTQDGLVAVRDQGAIPLKDRNAVRKLVADENNDRNALYREIASANGHPEWEKDIRNTFARVWVQESPAGTWYQNAKGAWTRK